MVALQHVEHERSELSLVYLVHCVSPLRVGWRLRAESNRRGTGCSHTPKPLGHGALRPGGGNRTPLPKPLGYSQLPAIEHLQVG